MSSLENVLRDRLACIMQALTSESAREMAQWLTNRVNDQIAGKTRVAQLTLPPACRVHEAAIAQALPPHMMNLSTLTLPWRAFDAVHPRDAQDGNRIHDTTSLLCSLPDGFAGAMRPTLSATGVWSGSILDELVRLLTRARLDVIMIGPYWSETGIGTVVRRLAQADMTGVQVSILTRPRGHHGEEGLAALLTLHAALTAAGAACDIFAPPIAAGWTPLLHAKAVVVDQTEAYLGSANFTGNGWDTSVELGVALRGHRAAQLGQWLVALRCQLEQWKHPYR